MITSTARGLSPGCRLSSFILPDSAGNLRAIAENHGGTTGDLQRDVRMGFGKRSAKNAAQIHGGEFDLHLIR
jgi:hypothetical protein